MSDEKKGSAITFLKAALAYYESLGIKVERVMTDNGSRYKSFAFRKACLRLATSAPNPIAPRPTARPSASSKLASANGPTRKPMITLTNEKSSSRRGCINTIGVGRTPA
jgi:hypothetical protein